MLNRCLRESVTIINNCPDFFSHGFEYGCRCVNHRQRSLALGVQFLLLRLLGMFFKTLSVCSFGSLVLLTYSGVLHTK